MTDDAWEEMQATLLLDELRPAPAKAVAVAPAMPLPIAARIDGRWLMLAIFAIAATLVWVTARNLANIAPRPVEGVPAVAPAPCPTPLPAPTLAPAAATSNGITWCCAGVCQEFHTTAQVMAFVSSKQWNVTGCVIGGSKPPTANEQVTWYKSH